MLKTRILKELASDTGLTFTGLRKQNWASFRNDEGVILLHQVPKDDVVSGRDILNMRSQFKKFVRGQVHGLKIIKS